MLLNAIGPSFWGGILVGPYVPALGGLPPALTSDEKLTMVFSLAPARHGSLYGTSWPQIVRPLTSGRWYTTLTSVMPMVCSTVAAGLASGSFSCAYAVAEPSMIRVVRSAL